MAGDDIQRHSPTTSDQDRRNPTVSDNDRPRPTPSAERKEEHTLTSREVMKLFEQSGLPRSQRSVERYCKDGKLDCYPDSDEQRYYITCGSTERLIGQLKEIQARHSQAVVDETRPTTSDNDRSEPSSSTDERAEAVHAEKLKAFEDQIFNLTVDNKAKEQVITQLKDQIKDDREEFVGKLTQYTRRVGQLETRLKQLEAPRRQETPVGAPNEHDAEFTEAEEQPQPIEEVI